MKRPHYTYMDWARAVDLDVCPTEVRYALDHGAAPDFRLEVHGLPKLVRR